MYGCWQIHLKKMCFILGEIRRTFWSFCILGMPALRWRRKAKSQDSEGIVQISKEKSEAFRGQTHAFERQSLFSGMAITRLRKIITQMRRPFLCRRQPLRCADEPPDWEVTFDDVKLARYFATYYPSIAVVISFDRRAFVKLAEWWSKAICDCLQEHCSSLMIFGTNLK